MIKKDSTKEEYDRNKILKGIKKAFEKRPFTEEQIEQIVDDIERRIRLKKTKEIKSKEIGKIVLEKLKETDSVAYMRFASVYRSFGSIRAFEKEIEKITA